jgi:hypothetical protein
MRLYESRRSDVSFLNRLTRGAHMGKLSFTEAFAKYGAKLANPQWAFSAIAKDGALVVSCWQHKFTIPSKGILRYSDRLSRWQRSAPGKNLLITHLEQAYKENLRVRLIIVSTQETAAVDAGEDVSRASKTFHLKEDFIGKVVSFDGDAFVIDFAKQDTSV